mgnify:CR=1 FL=1
MFLRGSLGRNPTIKIEDEGIRRSKTTKYLGVHIDETLSIRAYVEAVRTKGERIMMKFAGIGQSRFHFPLNVLRLYHNTIFSSIVGYGAGAHRISDKRIRQKLRTSQRRILLRSVGAFGTTPTMSLLVVLGVWPLDMQIKFRGAMYWIKRENYQVAFEIIGKNVVTKSEIKQALLTEWQHEWDNIQEG